MAAWSPNVNIMVKAAEKAARSLIRDFGEVEQLQVSKKGPSDFVSAADHRAEKIIREELLKSRPSFGFVLEECGIIEGSDGHHRWIVDPLDGTSNFLHGIPHWAISIALEKDGEVIAGVTYDAIRHELFWAEKGKGAFMQSKRLRVSGRDRLDMSIIGAGSPSKGRGDHDLFLKNVEKVLPQSASFRRMGAATLDLAYVAAGRLDGFWEYEIKSWDMAAGYLMIREAGGFATCPNGKPDPVNSGNILAGNPEIHKQLLKCLKN